MAVVDEAMDFMKNTKAKIVLATDGKITLGQVEGKYYYLIYLLSDAIVSLSKDGEYELDEIGKDLNECVKHIIDSNKEE